MYTNMSTISKLSYRDHHRCSQITPRTVSDDERYSLSVNENLPPLKLRRRRRAQATRSFYDNNENDENEPISSKWTIVRQRLPDILALSETYKPTTIRAQLVLLVALMNKQTTGLTTRSKQLNLDKYNNTISHIVPNNVIIDVSGRSRLIRLKRIPSEQMIYVDVDGLSFSISTRQFILAISQGFENKTAATYCPPAISDMLTDISKAKLFDDRRQYKRARMKMLFGQLIFLAVFILILTMVFALIISATSAISDLKSANYTLPYIPIQPLPSRKDFGGFIIRTEKEDSY